MNVRHYYIFIIGVLLISTASILAGTLSTLHGDLDFLADMNDTSLQSGESCTIDPIVPPFAVRMGLEKRKDTTKSESLPPLYKNMLYLLLGAICIVLGTTVFLIKNRTLR